MHQGGSTGKVNERVPTWLVLKERGVYARYIKVINDIQWKCIMTLLHKFPRELFVALCSFKPFS